MIEITPLSSHKSIIDALNNIRPGQKIVYFKGHLDAERFVFPRGPAQIVAEAALRLAIEGKLYLTQKRLSPPILPDGTVDRTLGIGDGFDYIATGASTKRMTPETFAKYKPARRLHEQG